MISSTVADDLVTHVVVDPVHLPAQIDALDAHRTQLRVWPGGYYALTNDVAARLAGREAFVRVDPLTGERIATGVVASGLLPARLGSDVVRDFACPHCGQRLAFENSVCLSCSNGVGFDLDAARLRRRRTATAPSRATRRAACAPNLDTAGCNWVVATGGTLCRSCSLTRTRPADGDPEMPAFVAAERAKRRLVVELVELGLPITDRRADPAARA